MAPGVQVLEKMMSKKRSKIPTNNTHFKKVIMIEHNLQWTTPHADFAKHFDRSLNWKHHSFMKTKQHDLMFSKHYWLIGRKLKM